MESGIDLTKVAAAQACGQAVSLQADWEIRDRLREVDYLLTQPIPRWPRLQRAPFDDTRAVIPAGEYEPGPQHDLPLSPPAGEAAAPQPTDAANAFFWAALAAMLAFLLAVGLVRPELFEVVTAKLR